MAELKMDGLSVALQYGPAEAEAQGDFRIDRGDGQTGEDVTSNSHDSERALTISAAISESGWSGRRDSKCAARR